MVDRAKRYHPEAYRFVRQALDYALRRTGKRRHISGQELLRAISDYGKARFGPLVRSVFEEWGVSETLDFGHIVFELVDRGIMSKRPEDSLDDFRGGYDFQEEFDDNYDYLAELRGDSSSSSPISREADASGVDPDLLA